MARYFEEHRVREVQSLNGVWKFMTDPQDEGEQNGWQNQLPTKETVTVPSMWNTELGLLEYDGAAWYQKDFYTKGGDLRFCFGGVMTEADVWLDGAHLGSHYGGFCQFDFIVPNVAEGEHILTVRADNRFDEHSIPQVYVDWYHYGGITRDVSVEILQGISVLYNRMEYQLDVEKKEADGNFVLELYNGAETETTSVVKIQLGQWKVYEEQITLQAKEQKEITTPLFHVADLELWDMENPVLYPVVITTDTDDLRDRVGFREICMEDHSVKLNGQAFEFRGVNRHEEHPDWGFAFPQKLMKRDLDILEDMGCNTIRGSHYPNSQNFVDMLDERGLLFWSEIPIWGVGFPEKALGDPIVVERGLKMHQEMVKYYYNHPSIVIWGMHNEILSQTQNAYEMSKLYYHYLKENGGNRLVTYAGDKPMEDICLEFCDIICINAYKGWYSGSVSDWDMFVEKFRQRREALGFAHKPVIFSEFGAAAIYGHHTFDDIRWTEEYQAKLISYCLELFHKDPMVVGFYIWHFCDARTCLEASLNRARGFNNKGLLSEYRKPKAAYYAVRDLYRKYAKEAAK